MYSGSLPSRIYIPLIWESQMSELNSPLLYLWIFYWPSEGVLHLIKYKVDESETYYFSPAVTQYVFAGYIFGNSPSLYKCMEIPYIFRQISLSLRSSRTYRRLMTRVSLTQNKAIKSSNNEESWELLESPNFFWHSCSASDRNLYLSSITVSPAISRQHNLSIVSSRVLSEICYNMIWAYVLGFT